MDTYESDMRVRNLEITWANNNFELDKKLRDIQVKGNLTVEELAAITGYSIERVQDALDDSLNWIKERFTTFTDEGRRKIKEDLRKKQSFYFQEETK